MLIDKVMRNTMFGSINSYQTVISIRIEMLLSQNVSLRLIAATQKPIFMKNIVLSFAYIFLEDAVLRV